ncbi:hypothetical protein AMECASPLE_003140 [Ameca splendens]|uniref:Uncharacterized protein n=1 Tax=Ameca splendens TaxID=208324 RepID=A0ABV0XMG8_9TELE
MLHCAEGHWYFNIFHVLDCYQLQPWWILGQPSDVTWRDVTLWQSADPYMEALVLAGTRCNCPRCCRNQSSSV